MNQMVDFWQTQMGHRFFESTMPGLVKAVEDQTKAMKALTCQMAKVEKAKSSSDLKTAKVQLRDMLLQRGKDRFGLTPTEEKMADALNLDPDVIGADVEARQFEEWQRDNAGKVN